MTILVTGSSGFIGFHLCKNLILKDELVIGLDNMNNYYDKKLKEKRLGELIKISSKSNFEFINANLEDKRALEFLFKKYKPNKVVNLAAQAGVRYSLENPEAYIQSNIVGFSNILEICRNNEIDHLIYASSSSVYGGNRSFPFKENQKVDKPISLYAASKKSNELMAYTYSHLYKIPSTGLRFFTVYGPWGRPDMSLFLFTDAIFNERPIKIFNKGNMVRDFTYIDDIIEGITRIISKPPQTNNLKSQSCINFSQDQVPYKIFNIGNSNPVNLMEFIQTLEETIGRKAKKEFLPMQPGDVMQTLADTTALEEWIDYKPSTSIKKGISEFINWYKDFYSITK